MIKTEKNDKKLEISFLSPFELVDTESGNLIDIWKQESSDDKHLMDYFLETPAYIEMQKTEKYLVCGRKGTGKTALRRAFIANNSREDSCILDIQAEDIFTPSFFNKITQSVIDDHQYALKKDYKDKIKLLLLIKWVELIIDCDTYYNNQLQKNRLPEAIKNILTKFLELNGYTLGGDMGSRIFQLEKITIEESIGTAFGVKGINLNGSKKSTSTLNPLEFDLEEIRPYLEAYVFELLFRTGKKCFLLIDGVDKLRISADPEIYKKIIVDFIVATSQLNEKMRRVVSNNSRVIIFLRNDILDLISGEYDDMGKLTGDYCIYINWQSDFMNSDSLLNKLIDKRIEGGINIRTKGNNKKIYEKPLFLNAIKNSKISASYYNNPPEGLMGDDAKLDIQRFFYDKTLLRPRDFIQFFGILSKSKTMFEFDKSYSNYLKAQILDEIKPNVANYELTEKTINAVCKGQGSFTGDRFINAYMSFGGKERDAKETLSKLYHYGLIGYKHKNHYGTNFTHFCYREEDTREFNPDNCILHSGLYKAYGVI